MKKIYSISFILIFGVVSVFAFSPSQELQQRMDTAAFQLESIIAAEGEGLRSWVLMKLENYKSEYAEDERSLYILNYLISKLDSTWDHSSNLIGVSFFEEYSINSTEYGTQTDVIISWDQRRISTNALPNHETWDFPNSGNPHTISSQEVSYSIPYLWEYTGKQTDAHTPGIALNGVKFEPQTAEVVKCQSGESYRIEAIQDMTNIGLDHQHAHVQPTGEYHYHGISQWLVDFADTGEDLVHIGFAQDGFPMYYSKSGQYSPSYQLSDTIRTGTGCSYRNKTVILDKTEPDGTYVSDWEYFAGLGDLDACNGIVIDDEYIYLVTDEYPYISRCLNGKYTEMRWKERWFRR